MEFERFVEEVLLTHSSRGMERVREYLEPGYCGRAAKMLLEARGNVLIGTGFPVKGVFETDGPVGAVSIYAVLDNLGAVPVFVCAPPISRILSMRYRTCEFPIAKDPQSRELGKRIMEEYDPSLLVSVERAGRNRHGQYTNFQGVDISDHTAKLDILFDMAVCPTLAFGDGGNEIGMGKALPAFDHLDIEPSVTGCDELVISTVTNWGVYGAIAVMSRITSVNLFNSFDPEEIMGFLVENGAIDGITHRQEMSEDGFHYTTGLEIIERLSSVLV